MIKWPENADYSAAEGDEVWTPSTKLPPEWALSAMGLYWVDMQQTSKSDGYTVVIGRCMVTNQWAAWVGHVCRWVVHGYYPDAVERAKEEALRLHSLRVHIEREHAKRFAGLIARIATTPCWNQNQFRIASLLGVDEREAFDLCEEFGINPGKTEAQK